MEKNDVGTVPDMSTDITVLAVYVPEAECEPSAVTDQIRLAKQHRFLSGLTSAYQQTRKKKGTVYFGTRNTVNMYM